MNDERAALAEQVLESTISLPTPPPPEPVNSGWEMTHLPLSDGTMANLPVRVGAWPWELEYGEMPREAELEWEIVILPCAFPVPKGVADALRQHPEGVPQ